jgi:hypothetical protein
LLGATKTRKNILRKYSINHANSAFDRNFFGYSESIIYPALSIFSREAVAVKRLSLLE